jgi:hypothetical protein
MSAVSCQVDVSALAHDGCPAMGKNNKILRYNFILRFLTKLTKHNKTFRCMQKKGIRTNAKRLLIYFVQEKA